jgi:hypothetical protein
MIHTTVNGILIRMKTHSSSPISEILKQSFLIWQRSIPLVYVQVLFGFVASLLLINLNDSLIRPEYLLYIFGILMGLLFCAFTAGLYQMTSSACRYFLEKNTPKDSFLPSYKMSMSQGPSFFQDFLSGIGQHFITVSIGMLLQVLFVFLLSLCLLPITQKAMLAIKPILPKLIEHSGSFVHNQKLLQTLAPAQLQSLQDLVLGVLVAIALYALFWVLTCLWPVMLLWYSKNPLKAYGLSIRQFFRDPIRLGAIVLLYTILSVVFVVFSSTGVLFIEVLSKLLMVFLNIGFHISLFVYAWHSLGRPTRSLDEEVQLSAQDTPPA